MILVSFCRILNGLSDEINLFWRCSSPLNKGEKNVGGHLSINLVRMMKTFQVIFEVSRLTLEWSHCVH